jgi:hypothetical protein
MSTSSKILNDSFWKVLATIETLDQDLSFEELLHDLGEGVEQSDILEVVSFLKKFNYPVFTTKKAGSSWICFDGEKPRMMIDFSLGEWIAMQAHFPLLDTYKGKEIYNSLAQGLKRVEMKNPESDLYKILDEEAHMELTASNMDVDREDILKAINKASLYSDLLLVGSRDNGISEVFVHKVVFLDGVLSLIGEDTKDRCLVCFEFDEIDSVKIVDNYNYSANFAGAEIDDFVLAIRSITGNEERLVLRISSPEKVNLRPEFHFLGNPYVTTNTDGEFIWAASVEVSNELFKWLASIENECEILDPHEIREQFENYKKAEFQNPPLKKAS